MYLCVRGIDLALSTILIFDFGVVLTVVCFIFHLIKDTGVVLTVVCFIFHFIKDTRKHL